MSENKVDWLNYPDESGLYFAYNIEEQRMIAVRFYGSSISHCYNVDENCLQKVDDYKVGWKFKKVEYPENPKIAEYENPNIKWTRWPEDEGNYWAETTKGKIIPVVVETYNSCPAVKEFDNDLYRSMYVVGRYVKYAKRTI